MEYLKDWRERRRERNEKGDTYVVDRGHDGDGKRPGAQRIVFILS